MRYILGELEFRLFGGLRDDGGKRERLHGLQVLKMERLLGLGVCAGIVVGLGPVKRWRRCGWWGGVVGLCEWCGGVVGLGEWCGGELVNWWPCLGRVRRLVVVPWCPGLHLAGCRRG